MPQGLPLLPQGAIPLYFLCWEPTIIPSISHPMNPGRDLHQHMIPFMRREKKHMNFSHCSKESQIHSINRIQNKSALFRKGRKEKWAKRLTQKARPGGHLSWKNGRPATGGGGGKRPRELTARGEMNSLRPPLLPLSGLRMPLSPLLSCARPHALSRQSPLFSWMLLMLVFIFLAWTSSLSFPQPTECQLLQFPRHLRLDTSSMKLFTSISWSGLLPPVITYANFPRGMYPSRVAEAQNGRLPRTSSFAHPDPVPALLSSVCCLGGRLPLALCAPGFQLGWPVGDTRERLEGNLQFAIRSPLPSGLHRLQYILLPRTLAAPGTLSAGSPPSSIQWLLPLQPLQATRDTCFPIYELHSILPFTRVKDPSINSWAICFLPGPWSKYIQIKKITIEYETGPSPSKSFFVPAAWSDTWLHPSSWQVLPLLHSYCFVTLERIVVM